MECGACLTLRREFPEPIDLKSAGKRVKTAESEGNNDRDLPLVERRDP